MSRLRCSRDAAVAHLRGRCSLLAAFIERQGPLKLRVDPEADLFSALARAIVYQQLSGKAAATIHGRFVALFEDGRPGPEPAAILDMKDLRAAGLSRNKSLSIQDLARKAADGTLASLRRMSRMSDEEVIQNLCQVRGIGRWTAQMVLLFNLGRPDVMPANDLGVQKGVQAVYSLRRLPRPEQVLRRTSTWAGGRRPPRDPIRRIPGPTWRATRSPRCPTRPPPSCARSSPRTGTRAS